MRGLPTTVALACLAASALTGPAAGEELDAATVVARHIAARGGTERWSEVEALEMKGTYSAFSKRSEFTLIRARGDRYRLDFTLLDAPAIRARDEKGPWGLHVLLQPEVGYVTEDPYKSQFERESLFPPVLLDFEAKGLEVEYLGPGDLDGIAIETLQVTFPGGEVETWHLDAESFLEVAVDSRVKDYTQFAEPIDQRVFYDDFRDVEGLVIPFLVEAEFGARLESMAVSEVLVDPEIDPTRWSPPPTGD